MESKALQRLLKHGQKYWYHLADLNDQKQAEWLHQSEDVYNALFEADYREPFSNFQKYICQKRIEDFYYVGVYNGVVVGMLFFSIYPRWIFIPYAGVDFYRLQDTTLHRILSSGMFGVLYKYLSMSVNRTALFELEKLKGGDIARLATEMAPLADSKPGYTIINRIRSTYTFQKIGAWKIPYINYLQPLPGTEPGSKEIGLHLMYLPSVPSSDPPVLSRSQVAEMLRFIYLEYFKDGFDESKNWILGGPEATYGYLEKLPERALDHYPHSAGLVKISLEDLIRDALKEIKDEEDTNDTFLQKADKIIQLQPNFMGMGINLNALIKRILGKKYNGGHT